MKISTLLNKCYERENVIGYLSLSDITKIRSIAEKAGIDAFGLERLEGSFLSADIYIRMIHDSGTVEKKYIRSLLKIIVEANNQLKTEKWRYDAGTKSLYMYSKQHLAYVFYSKSTRTQYRQLVKSGKYI